MAQKCIVVNLYFTIYLTCPKFSWIFIYKSETLYGNFVWGKTQKKIVINAENALIICIHIGKYSDFSNVSRKQTGKKESKGITII